MLYTAGTARNCQLSFSLTWLRVRHVLALCTMLIGMQTSSASAQGTPTETLTRAEVGEVCARPYPPYPEHYHSAAEFNTAREVYYKEASVYVSHCIVRWVNETRQRYEEMFLMEADAYQRDRQLVIDEMRSAAHLKY